MCRPKWWALENPVGHLMDYMGRAQLIFQPWEYGDPWTKRTAIWGDLPHPKSCIAIGTMCLINCRCTPVRGAASRILPTSTNLRRLLSHSLLGQVRRQTRIFAPSPRPASPRHFSKRIDKKGVNHHAHHNRPSGIVRRPRPGRTGTAYPDTPDQAPDQGRFPAYRKRPEQRKNRPRLQSGSGALKNILTAL